MSRLLVGLLMVAYCLPAAYVTLWPDTVRDLAASLSLARGEAIALVGPPINFGPYAGPAWIWLQAPPLVFFPTFVATSIYVAFVASLKFPALYVLGRRLSGPRLGGCMAVAAAFPSFFVYQWIMFFHPNWVEVMVVATLILFLVADQRRSVAMTYVAVAMLGLAVQIHTTTVFYFPFAAVVLYRIGVRGPKIAAHLIAMLILVALWFTPVLFAPPQERGVLGKATERIAQDLSHFDLGAVAVALESAFVRFPIVIGESYGRAGHVPAWLWIGGMCIVGLAIAVGAVLRLATSKGRLWFVAAVALLLAAWTIAVAVRSYTSFYLVYFLLPLTAVVLGLSLESAASARWPLVRAMGAAALVLLVLSLVATAYGARSIGRSGIIDSRILAMGNLAHPVDATVRGTYFTVAARDALAVEACAMQGSAITLHGELAYAALTSLGLDYRLHCPTSKGRFVVFGTGPGDHLAALPESIVPMLAIRQGSPARGMRLLRSVRAIHPTEARGFAKVFDYVEPLRDRGPMQRVALDFETRPDELVAVYRHKPYDSAWTGFSVRKDAVAATPVFTTFDSWIYQAGDRGGHWKVEFETDAPQWVEVIVIPR
jgi:hypothetical protein